MNQYPVSEETHHPPNVCIFYLLTEFIGSMVVSAVSSGFPSESKDMQEKLIGGSKLVMGVNVSDGLSTCPDCTPIFSPWQLQ